MEETEQITFDIPSQVKKIDRPNSKTEEKIKKIEKDIEDIKRRLDVLYRSLRG